MARRKQPALLGVVRFDADENFNNDIIRGVLRRHPHVDIVRIQEVGFSGADDPAIPYSLSVETSSATRTRP